MGILVKDIPIGLGMGDQLQQSLLGAAVFTPDPATESNVGWLIV